FSRLGERHVGIVADRVCCLSAVSLVAQHPHLRGRHSWGGLLGCAHWQAAAVAQIHVPIRQRPRTLDRSITQNSFHSFLLRLVYVPPYVPPQSLSRFALNIKAVGTKVLMTSAGYRQGMKR